MPSGSTSADTVQSTKLDPYAQSIRAQYDAGVSAKVIAEEYDVSAPTVSKCLRNTGPLRSISDSHRLAVRPLHLHHLPLVESLDPSWAAEFRGLFSADGHIGIMSNGSSHGQPSFGLRVAIQLRDDSLPLLADIQSTLGG